MKYLDESGLAHLWEKAKEEFSDSGSGGASTAADVSYDNTNASFFSDSSTVQTAIDTLEFEKKKPQLLPSIILDKNSINIVDLNTWAYSGGNFGVDYRTIKNVNLKKVYDAYFKGIMIHTVSATGVDFSPVAWTNMPYEIYYGSISNELKVYNVTSATEASLKIFTSNINKTASYSWSTSVESKYPSNNMIHLPSYGYVWQPFYNYVFYGTNPDNIIAYAKKIYKEVMEIPEGSSGGLSEEEVKALIDATVGEVLNGKY